LLTTPRSRPVQPIFLRRCLTGGKVNQIYRERRRQHSRFTNRRF
jgi:hypothetical protein